MKPQGEDLYTGILLVDKDGEPLGDGTITRLCGFTFSDDDKAYFEEETGILRITSFSANDQMKLKEISILQLQLII